MDDAHHHDLPGGIGASPECELCPVCVLLQAVTALKPEVTQHLLGAARELTLALKAAMEAQAESYAHAAARVSESGLQHIDLD